jgi:inner membrane protein involved in colicin E2 resistance
MNLSTLKHYIFLSIVFVIVLFVFQLLVGAVIKSRREKQRQEVLQKIKQEEQKLRQAIVEPSIEMDAERNTAILTLENGQKIQLSEIDLLRHKNGISVKELNAEKMMRIS